MATPDDQRRARLLRLGLVLALAAVVVVIAIVLSSGGGERPATQSGGGAPRASSLYDGIPQSGVLLGKPAATRTLLEFADLQCPFCAEYAVKTMPTVVHDYVRSGKLRYELRIQAFLGPDSERAAGAAAVAARENRLYQFADAFYHQQGPENTGYVTDAFIARAAGVDPAAAVAGAKAGDREPLVRQAEKLSRDVGSGGTPDFYVRLAGGRLVPVNAPGLTPDAFVPALEQALAQR